MAERTDWAHADTLARAVIRDGLVAWPAFWNAIVVPLRSWACAPTFLGRASCNYSDWRHDLVLLAWERLQARDFHKLHRFYASPDVSGPRLRRWLYRTFKNLAIDHLRASPEFVRDRGKRRDDAHVYWRPLVSLSSIELDANDEPWMRVQASQLLSFLDDSGRETFRAALELWCAQYSPCEIAAALDLPSAENARCVVDAAKKLLRRHFRA
jgi:DNA-directed RNA polymerase specialized sigma24 family protein